MAGLDGNHPVGESGHNTDHQLIDGRLDSADAAIAAEAVARAAADALALEKGQNLADLDDVPTALVNLGLENVDNTSDADKPVSTDTQTALNLKQDAATATTDAELAAAIAGLTKSSVGLGNVDNTADAAKPVSTAQQTALNLKQDAATAATDAELTAAISALTKSSVGLGNVDNTSDANKPVSLATAAELDLKQPKDFGWYSGVDYDQGALVVVAHQPYTARDAHTSGPTFAGDLGSHWDLVVPGMEITSMKLTTTFATPSAIADVTDAGAGGAVWQAVCPANMGPIKVHCDKVALATTTGTGTAADTAYANHIRIFDEANNDLEGNQMRIQSVSTAARTWRQGIPLTVDLDNNASQKTYRVRNFMSNVGTNGCTGAIEATPASGIYSPVLKITRR